ncbi:hypothetical protein [Kineosporia succinea]|uniref:Uncharacterized protein n=1 Tax=Kineosporia succinea TaxID=84632 RepID=A0ABT9PBF8_9ACTN|nr:hypothetical protein [Kineosporia succinea]MDP9830036.1 hypothetical protein [Kineosporia succinea]
MLRRLTISRRLKLLAVLCVIIVPALAVVGQVCLASQRSARGRLVRLGKLGTAVRLISNDWADASRRQVARAAAVGIAGPDAGERPAPVGLG